MGKISDFIKGITLPEQKKRQALTLDAEFDDLLSQNQVLKSENLNLQAEVNPLKREIETLKDKVAQLTASAKNDLVFNKTTGTHTDPVSGDPGPDVHLLARGHSVRTR